MRADLVQASPIGWPDLPGMAAQSAIAGRLVNELSSAPVLSSASRGTVAMASLQTFFRTVVMLATLGLIAKAWYHFGLSVEELKAISSSVVEVAEKEWNNYWQTPTVDALANDPRLPPTASAPAPFTPLGGPMQPISRDAEPAAAPAPGMVQLAGGVPAEIVPLAPANLSSPWTPGGLPESTRLSADSAAQPPQPQDARLPALVERLTQLGARDQELVAWGRGGELTRFSCSVPWANSPAYSRHFEAVAATPLAAVEQAAAEIEAWRSGQK